MNPFRKGLELKRRFALAISALFLLFPAASQPHRVHHLFEGFGHAHDQVDSDQRDHHKQQDNDARTECVVQSVNQKCAAVPVEVAKLPIVAPTAEVFRPVLSRWIYHFTSSPFLQRAPPLERFSFSL